MHSSDVRFAIESAEGALSMIPEAERSDARRIIELCRRHYFPERDRGIDESIAREVSGLVEVLARRSAQAMPFAALGRMLFATLKADEKQASALLREFQVKLSQLGL